MAFSDNPIIDQYSRNEEKSERRVKDFLNQETGFICRKEYPDTGCDLDVEILLNGSKSSSWKFAIQLKSIENLNIVNNGRFISLSFETSRLGYLMRRIPSMGLVILYSVQENKCFYEYVDKLYDRLMEVRESEDWKANEKVNIHIPYTNVLTMESAAEIHQVFRNRFEQAVTMQNSHGPKYSLPTVNLVGDFKYDFNNLDHIKKFLSDYGVFLLSSYDLDIIFQMITRVPHLEIYQDKELLLVAAVSYSESSMHSESQIFCSKLSKYHLVPEEQLTLQFVTLKNQLALGYISKKEYIEKLKQLDTSGADEQNKITIEINLVNYQLASMQAFQEISPDLLTSIEKIFDRIEHLKCNERAKGLLTLWNGENLAYLVSTAGAAALGEMRIRESLGNPWSVEERKRALQVQLFLEMRFNRTIQAVNKAASTSGDDLLKAYSFSLEVRYFIHNHINYFSFEIPVNTMDGFKERIFRIMNASAIAYNFFLKYSVYKEAYDSLCNLIEVITLSEEGYGIKTTYEKGELYATKEKMEQELEVGRREIMFTNLIFNTKAVSGNRSSNGMFDLREFGDDQIESFAQTVLESFKLSGDRLIHIINELKAYRMFQQRCNDPNIQVLQYRQEQAESQKYAIPVQFVLRSITTGIETPPSSDMDALLSSWGF